MEQKKYFTKYLPGKLFLCSRDIQAGDEIKYITSFGEVGEAIADGSGDTEEVKYFKVIGEISPDALRFVTEGMEFNEDEIKYIKGWIGKYPNAYYGNVSAQIACPCCGTFK